MDDQTKIPQRRPVRWIVSLAIFCFLGGVAAWYFHGRTVWTEGRGTRIPSADATLREVLWTIPEPLDPALLATADQQYEPSLSPDGTELYFVRGKPGHSAHIFVTYRRDNQWTKPAPLDAINGPTDDLSPRLTADGKFLLFSSDRPGGAGGFDIWASERGKNGWGKPFNLGPAVNTEFNESNPDPTPDGRRLIFSTDRKAAGKEQIQAWRATIRQTVSTDYDLWIATSDPTTVNNAPTTAPMSQPAATTQATATLAFRDAHEIPVVNTAFVEGASCMSPAGDFLYFASNRPGGFGKFDLYRSRVIDDVFSPPENLGPAINTADNEADPSLTFGGFRLFFSSDRQSPQGVYSLHRSDSHEVFATTESRHLPKFGWSIWSLIISILFLIPLIMALRSAEWRRRLNTLQKCLILSLLIHAIVTFALSFVLVTQEVARYVRRELITEVAVNLGLPKDVEVGLAVRSQLSSDLPSSTAPPTPTERMAIAEQVPVSAQVKTDPPAHAVDRSSIASVAMITPPVSAPLVSPPSATTIPPILTPAATVLSNIDPKESPEKVADRASDAMPAIEKLAAPLQRTQTASVTPAAPQTVIASEIPQTSQTARDSAADPLTPNLKPATARPIAAVASQTAAPATSLPAESDPKIDNISPAAPANPRLSQPAPVATAQAAAPLSSAGPLATAIARPDDAPTPAADIATRNIAARPTTAPSSPSTTSASAIAHRTNDPIAVEAAAIPAAASIAPVGASVPDLPAIAMAPPRAAADPAVGRTQTAGDVLPSAPRADVAASSPKSISIGISSSAPAVVPSINPAGAPGIRAITPASIVVPNLPAQPDVAFAPLTGPLEPSAFTAPSSPFPRSLEERKPRVEKLGGTKDSEDAVDRGLGYLARNQEPDGRWALIAQNDLAATGRRPQSAHDIGNTGLAVLALITRDHTPDKPGPYRDTVGKALTFLLASQDRNGDLRGPLRGKGSGNGDMYDHAIATLALAETALMTKDQRYADAALRGAAFIVAAQDPQTGGWRYVPGEAGDTSVFGWQIMALHAVERLGLEIPAKTRELAEVYIRLATTGPRKMLASYRPRGAATGAMTAEMLYARMILGQKLEPDDIAPAIEYLAQQPPSARQPNLYYWYYGSLCMLQMQNDDWKRWNTRSREALIALQNRGGRTDGGWDADPKYADRGGRVYSTSIALLTLEVYYRYQPVRGN